MRKDDARYTWHDTRKKRRTLHVARYTKKRFTIHVARNMERTIHVTRDKGNGKYKNQKLQPGTDADAV